MKEIIVIIGGGAAGFFSAINIANKKPNAQIMILEKSDKLLYKVQISGGGRCNVTHSCFEPMQLIKNYPRGEKNLINIFHRFQPKDTIAWFAERGVQIKTEADGRMFPITDSSQSIIDCFMKEAKKNHIDIHINTAVDSLQKTKNDKWRITTSKGDTIVADKVVVCTGSHLRTWKALEELGHQVESPVASLFTFNTKDTRLRDMMGISLHHVQLSIASTKLKSEGPLLITHWGLSGPAILKLSAWGARELASMQYKFVLRINFTGLQTAEEVKNEILSIKNTNPKKQISNTILFHMPTRFYESMLLYSKIDTTKKWADFSSKEINILTELFFNSTLDIHGKSTNKDEFVTCGGISLKEIDFKTMQSKLHSNLFFAGEIMDIDAITGGFNFQAAWSTAWVVSESV